MKPLIIQATEDTPEIIFNPEEEIFRVSKISVPENAVAFYLPIFEWLKEYKITPNLKTTFDFDLEYINSASSKRLFEMIALIEKINENSKVLIRWHYEKIDEDMLDLGERFKNLVNIDFEFVAH